MKIENKRQFIAELFFLLGTAFYIMYYFIYIGYYWYVEKDPARQIPLQRLFYIGVFCFLVKIVLTKYQWKEAIVGIIGAILMFLCWKASGGIDYPVNYLIIIAMKNVDLKKVMKIVFACGVVALIYGFTWFFLNAPDKLTTVKDYGRGLVEIRYKFCTWHANTIHLMIMVLIVSFLYAYYEKMKWWSFLVFLFLNYEFFLLTKSRTAFYCGTMAIIAYALLKYAKKLFGLKLSLILLEIGNLIGIYLSIYYGLFLDVTNQRFMQLDSLITGRLTVARSCFLETGIPILGSNIGGRVCGYGIYTQVNDGYVTELGIVRTLLEYGPIVFVLFCTAVLVGVWILHKNERYGAMILLEIGFIACGVEAYFPAAYNLKAFVLGVAFYQLMTINLKKKRRIMSNAEE